MDEKYGCEIPNTVKKLMRSVLLSKIGGISLKDVSRDYMSCSQEELNYRKYGFHTLEDFLLAMPDVAKIVDRCGGKRVFGLGIENLSYANSTAREAVYKPNYDTTPWLENSQDLQRVFVGNLPSDVTEYMLRQHFIGYKFSNLRLNSIGEKKIAFLEACPISAMQMCNEMNGSKLYGRTLIVDFAKTNSSTYSRKYSRIPVQSVDSPNSNELIEVICSRSKRPSNNMTNIGGGYLMSSNEDTEFRSGSSTLRIEGNRDSLSNSMSDSVFPLKPSRNEKIVHERSSSTEISDQRFENDHFLDFSGFSDELPEVFDDQSIKTLKSDSGSSLSSSDHGPQMTKLVTYDAYVSFYHASKEAIMLLFSSCDPVDVVMVNPNTRNEIDYTQVGHCYVKFRTIKDLLRAGNSCQGMKINERAIEVRFANMDFSLKPDCYSSSLHPSSQTCYSTRDVGTSMSPEFQLFNDLITDDPSWIMSESNFKKMLAETCSVGSLITSLDLPDNIKIFVTSPDPMDCKYFWGVLGFEPHRKHMKNVFTIMTQELEVISSTLTVADYGVKRGVARFESQWSRVWIKSWSALSAVVFFIDFGNTETISRNDVYALPDQYWNTPPCAIPFKLSEHFDVVSRVNESITAVVKRPGRLDHIVEIAVIVDSV